MCANVFFAHAPQFVEFIVLAHALWTVAFKATGLSSTPPLEHLELSSILDLFLRHPFFPQISPRISGRTTYASWLSNQRRRKKKETGTAEEVEGVPSGSLLCLQEVQAVMVELC